jgi:flagellar biosynthesis chaperone FliJ
MTLDEAIKHCEEKAEELDELSKQYDEASRYFRNHNKDIVSVNAKVNAQKCLECFECANEHRQLAEWLRELKAYREAKERIRRGLQSCFNMVHCESNHDILEGQERAFKYCIEQLEVNADG